VSTPDPFGLVGQVLDGQFRVDKMVGEGGFSIVYRGHHQGLNEPIAIKCLKLPAALGTALVDTFVQRFRDESRILYRLSQGNLHVVRSIAAGTTQAPATGALVPYMVLEWLEGRSLQTDFEQRKGQKGRPLAEVIRMFDSAADGLAHAHAHGVIHRDLNPGNLFLTKTAAGEKMKVLDFGVAKIMHDSTLDIGPRAQTIGAIRIFAPAYGAPEQFDDRIGQVGAWSDVYAFALVILQALQDKCVMEGEHLGDFAQGAVDPQKRPTPRALGIDVPEEVERVFARATALYTKNRWQSAGDFWRSLVTAANNASGVAVVNPLGSTTPAISAASPAAAAPKDAPVPVAKGPLAKTMPLGSTTPGVPPGFRPGAPRPRTPTTIGIPAPASPNANAPASQPAPNTPPVPGAPRPPMGSTPGVPRPPMGSSASNPAVPRPPMPSSPGAGVSPPAAPARTTARPPSAANMPAAQAAPPSSSRSGSASAPITKPPTTAPVPQPITSPTPGAPMRPQMDSEPPTGIAPPPLSARGGSVNMRTATGLAPSPWDAGEPEDESTKVGAPTDEVLRAIADAESKPPARAHQQGTAAMPPLKPPHAPNPSPVLENSDELATLAHAALGGRPGASAQAPVAEESKRESSIPPPPDSGGTLMMVAPGAEAQHAQRLEYQARIAEEDAEKAAAPPKPTKQQQTVAFAQRPAFPQPPPPLQVQPSAAPRPEVSQPYDQATQAAPLPPVKRAGLNSTLAMASPLQYPPPPHGAPPDPHTSQQVPQQDAFGAEGPFGAPITPPVSPGATSQIHGLSAPPNHQVAMPANPMPQGDGSSITAWAPLVPPTPAQGGAVAGPMGSPQQQTQQGSGAPFPAHFNNPGARPSMVDGGALPQSFAEAHVPAAGEKKFPVIPVAAGAGLLAVIGIVLVVVALKATKAPNPDGTTSASPDTSSAGPVPVPVPVTTETASAAVTTPPAATVIEADDASAAPAATEDASVADAAAAAASASASATAPATAAPPPTVATATPGTAAPPPTVATATPPPNPFAPPPPASAKPAADPNAFSEGAARGKLAQANGVLAFCKKEGGVTGPGNASVTFAIDGSVAGVALDPPYAGTSEGNCVAGQFRRAKVAPFTGAPQTIRHSFEVPK